MKMAVLVLNANYEPVNVCDMKRAIGLLLTEKASLVSNGRGEIKTVAASYPIPSIIRLQKMVHRPHPQLKLSRREVFRRDNYTCQYCGRYFGKHSSELTIDHILPRHLGGQHIWTNVAAACPACNHHKGGRTLIEANMRLLHLPEEPPTSVFYIFSHHLEQNRDWEPFLSGW